MASPDREPFWQVEGKLNNSSALVQDRRFNALIPIAVAIIQIR